MPLDGHDPGRLHQSQSNLAFTGGVSAMSGTSKIGNRIASIVGLAVMIVVSICLCARSSNALAQSEDGAAGLPLSAPGYQLYYHGDQGSNVFATRWGYYDGWTDGRHDRGLGRTIEPTEQDRYKLAPDHGQHPELSRDKYKNLYRTAYLHGYEQGSKL
jgi:hypothetical protein